MLYKKLNLPINLPLISYEKFGENKFVIDIVNEIIKSSKIGVNSSISLFRDLLIILSCLNLDYFLNHIQVDWKTIKTFLL